MTEADRERLSALVDDELDHAEAVDLLNRVARDAQLRQVWEQYYLIRDSLQGEFSGSARAGLFERVQREIDAEPVLYRMEAFRRGALRPLAGLALAASVAVVAVIGFRGFVSPADTGALVASRAGPATPASVAAGPERDPGFDRRLDAYLVNHSERVGSNVHGVLPYARIVAYDAGR
jgi:negative regulator of sigma E activity